MDGLNLSLIHISFLAATVMQEFCALAAVAVRQYPQGRPD